MLPVVIREIGRRQLGVFRHVRLHRAGEGGILFDGSGSAASGRIEAGNRDARYVDVRRAPVHRQQRKLHRLSPDHEAIVADRIECQAMGYEDRILIVALLDLEAKIDLIARRVGKRKRSKLGAKSSYRRETGFDWRRCARVVSVIECVLRALGLASQWQRVRRLMRRADLVQQIAPAR